MNAPKLPSFFKTPSPKRFRMATRYYDERKERIQQAINKAEKNETDSIGKGHFTETWKKRLNKSSGSSSIRVILITVMLCLFTYWILKL